jgi:hypothetical protein
MSQTVNKKVTKKTTTSKTTTKQTSAKKSTKSKNDTPVSTISKTKAVSILQASGGRFVRVSFSTTAGVQRTLGCKFKELTNLGNIKVIETKTKNNPGGYKTIVAKNIYGITCDGTTYKVRK